MSLDPASWRCVLSLCASLLLLGACTKAPPAPPSPPAGPPPVDVAAAVARDVEVSDEFPGRITAIESVEIRARVTGYLESLHFRPGSEVRKGELLFVVDPRPFAARLEEARAALANTDARLALARTEQARQTLMLKDHATSQREYDTAAADVRTLEAELRANLASIASAQLDLDYTRVVAPIAGRVGKEEITVGNLVQGDAPDSPVLTTIVSVDPVYVSFEADERTYLKYIAPAREAPLEVEVGLADEAGFPHKAQLAFVDNRLADATGTVRLRAVLPNAERRFTPGLFARVRLHATQRAERTVLVRDSAIGTDQNKRYVLAVGDDGIANYREVVTGRQHGALRAVLSGLAEGEVIVVDGLQRVRPGAPVTPNRVPMEPTSSTPATGVP